MEPILLNCNNIHNLTVFDQIKTALVVSVT